MSKIYTQSFVLYESVYAQFERLINAGKMESANKYINAVMQYGLHSVLPEDEDEVWLYGLDNVIASIDSAKTNYRKKIIVPERELAECLRKGMTQSKIAERFNCSVDTIQRRIKEYGLNCLPPQEYFDYDEDTAENGTKKGRSYHFLSHSHSNLDYLSDYEEEKNNDNRISLEANALGF